MDEEKSGRSRWRSIEFASVTALGATLVCLIVGQAAEQFAAQTATTSVDIAKVQPRFNAIDYATTAAIKGATVVIGPCDTHTP